MLDEKEFLSPVRAAHAVPGTHIEEPFTVNLGGNDFTVGYEPAESSTGLFGGNSELARPDLVPGQLPSSSRRACASSADFYGDDLMVEYPTGASTKRTPGRDRRRPVAGGWSDLFLRRPRRPAAGATARTSCSRPIPDWRRPDPVPRVLPRRHRGRAWAPRTRPAGPRLVADLDS